MANDKTAEAINKLRDGVDALKESDTWQQWLDVQSRFHQYSWGNSLLITLQCPNAARVAGFRAWLEVGRHVRKGEKGIQILAPCTYKRESKDGEEETVIRGFRPVYVFDISQTDGEDLPEVAHKLKGDAPEHLIDQLIGIAQTKGWTVTFARPAGTANGYAEYSQKSIVVSPELSTLQQAKTLIHEIGHALMHDPNRPDHDRNAVELEAESVAYVVASAMSIDTSDYSFGYVASWGADSAKIEKCAERINKTAREILSGLEVN